MGETCRTLKKPTVEGRKSPAALAIAKVRLWHLAEEADRHGPRLLIGG
jgi:hypothetical protein